MSVPREVSTPVPALYTPVMLAVLVKPSRSPAVKPAEMVTVAPAICVSSASLTVTVLSITTPPAFSVYPVVAPAVTTGASLTGRRDGGGEYSAQATSLRRWKRTWKLPLAVLFAG